MKSLQTILYDRYGRAEHDESYQVTRKIEKIFFILKSHQTILYDRYGRPEHDE